jgi:hypothetical protein
VALPEAIGDLEGLTDFLYLHDNRLTELPGSMAKLNRLRYLNISKNGFAAWPDLLGGLAGLVELRASDNRITSVPDSISRLSRLRELHLRNTCSPRCASRWGACGSSDTSISVATRSLRCRSRSPSCRLSTSLTCVGCRHSRSPAGSRVSKRVGCWSTGRHPCGTQTEEPCRQASPLQPCAGAPRRLGLADLRALRGGPRYQGPMGLPDRDMFSKADAYERFMARWSCGLARRCVDGRGPLDCCPARGLGGGARRRCARL